MKQDGANTKDVIEVLQEVRNELVRIEGRLQRLKDTLKETIPELEENIDVVQYARTKQNSDPVRTNFQLSASIFAEADLDQKLGKVVLWIGANTAVELTYDEAEDMLTKNLEKKKESLEKTVEDLKFAKSQVTTADVAIARVYNNDVKERRLQKNTTEE